MTDLLTFTLLMQLAQQEKNVLHIYHKCVDVGPHIYVELGIWCPQDQGSPYSHDTGPT